MFRRNLSYYRKQEIEDELRLQKKLHQMATCKYLFQSVAIDDEMAKMIFMYESYFIFFLTDRNANYKFDLCDVMDIDETNRDEHIVRLAIRPANQFTCLSNDLAAKSLVRQDADIPTIWRPHTPIVVTINFFTWDVYARFIDLLIHSRVFYRNAKPPPTPSQLESMEEAAATTTCGFNFKDWLQNKFGNWIKTLTFATQRDESSNSDSEDNVEVDAESWKLKLRPERARHLENDLHILDGWKEPTVMASD